MRRSRVESPRPEILISPLIDVVFILLVFVVLVARFVDREEINVRVPVSTAGAAATGAPVAITLGADGSVRVQGVELGDAGLQEVLAQARGDHSTAVVIADADAPLQRAVDAITAAKLAGFEAVAISTRPPEPGLAAP